MTPKLVVETLSPFPSQEEPTEIRARLAPNVFKNEQARTFFVSVRNVEGRTAEDVVPVVWIVGTSGSMRLVMVAPPGKPWMSFGWPGTPEEFDHDICPFATALIFNEKTRRTSVTLYPGGFSQPFLLFFTVRGQDAIFLPSETKVALGMPRKFRLVLMFQMKDWRVQRLKTYEIDAKSWDSVHVTEVRKSRFPLFRKSLK